LKVTTERVDECVAKLVIEIEDNELQPRLEQVARRLSSRVQVPGFRKGRAPYGVVARFFGEEYIRGEALEEMAEELLRAAISEQGLEPYLPPALTAVELKPARLEFSVPLGPVVELGDYRSLHIERPAVEVSDEEVERALERLRRRHGQEQVVERPAEEGDLVAGQLVIVDRTGAEHKLEQFLVQASAEAKARSVVPELPARLLGAKAGDVVEYEVELPADYALSSVAGQRVTVRFVAQAVKQLQLPPLDDGFAALVGDYDNLEALKADLRERIRKEKEDRAEAELREKAIEALAQIASVKYPPQLLERTIDLMLEGTKEELQSRRMSFEAMLKAANLSEQDYRERLRPWAEQTLRQQLALQKFAEVEGITVSDEEVTGLVEKAINRGLAADPAMQAYLRSEDARERIRADMRASRVLRRLVSIVTGEPEPEQELLAPEEMPAPAVAVVEGTEEAQTPEEEISHE